MSKILNRITARLADRTSRRGFFSVMGKVIAGLSAITAGEVFTAGQGNAASNQTASPANPSYVLECCNLPPGGYVCPGYCPSGTHPTSYTWMCCGNGHIWTCHDCALNSNGKEVCTYATGGHYAC